MRECLSRAICQISPSGSRSSPPPPPPRRAAAAEGDNLVALEHAVWQLLEVFFIDVTRSGGYVAEDLASWLADNGAALDEMMGRASLDSRVQVDFPHSPSNHPKRL